MNVRVDENFTPKSDIFQTSRKKMRWQNSGLVHPSQEVQAHQNFNTYILSAFTLCQKFPQ